MGRKKTSEEGNEEKGPEAAPGKAKARSEGRREKAPSHEASSPIKGYDEQSSQMAFARALGRPVQREGDKETPQDGEMLEEDEAICFVEVKSQMKPGSMEARIKPESLDGKLALMRMHLELREVAVPFVLVNPLGADMVEGGPLTVRFAFWPPIRGTNMSWKTVAVSGVLDVEDLTEAKLFDLGEAIRTELAAYTKELTPERFDEALTALEARPTGRDIRNINRRSRKSKKRVVREVAGNMTSEDQREVFVPLVENMTSEDQREVVVPIVGNMTPKDQREVVVPIVGNMTPEDQREVVVPIVGNMTPKDQREVVVPIVGNMAPKDQREVVVPIVGNMTSDEQRETIDKIAENMSADNLQKLIEQLQQKAEVKNPKRKNGKK